MLCAHATCLWRSLRDASAFPAAGVLFLIEGAGQSGLAMNWGDGLCTDEAIISELGISDPNSFFQSLVQKPYVNQVVAAPHVYPPSISMATTETQVGGRVHSLRH